MGSAGTDAQRAEWQRGAVYAWVKTCQLDHLKTCSLGCNPYPFPCTFSKKSQKVAFKNWNSISPRGKRDKPIGDSTNKGLLSIIYKEQLQVHKKRTEGPTRQGKIFESILIKRNSKSQETEKKNMSLTSLSHWKNENSQHTAILLGRWFKERSWWGCETSGTQRLLLGGKASPCRLQISSALSRKASRPAPEILYTGLCPKRTHAHTPEDMRDKVHSIVIDISPNWKWSRGCQV